MDRLRLLARLKQKSRDYIDVRMSPRYVKLRCHQQSVELISRNRIVIERHASTIPLTIALYNISIERAVNW
jgi:hypothetical protein